MYVTFEPYSLQEIAIFAIVCFVLIVVSCLLFGIVKEISFYIKTKKMYKKDKAKFEKIKKSFDK